MKGRADMSLLEKLMENKLIKKKILDYIPSLYDISSLARTSKYVNYLIYNEKITRYMLQYSDKQDIIITINEGYPEKLYKPQLNNIRFTDDDEFYEMLYETENFFGEIFLYKNLITINIENEIEKYKKKNRILFAEKLAEEMRLNCQVRKNATILELNGNFFKNEYMIIHALCYINHENIRCIKIPIHSFTSSTNKYKGLKNDIFKGFPNLNELVLFDHSTINDYRDILKNKKIIKRVLKDFSKKKNARLILQYFETSYKILDFIFTVLKIGNKYKIDIKSDSEFIFPLFRREKYQYCSITKCIHFPMGDISNYFFCEFSSSSQFLDIMINLKCYKNLEEIEFKFMYNNIKDGLIKACKYMHSFPSLTHCKKMRKVKFDFIDYYGEDNFDINLFYKDLEYLGSLMPETVENLELNYAFDLTRKSVERLNKCMPNIKLLIMNSGSYKDCDCLKGFKNLKALISNRNQAIILPKELKLFAIRDVDFVNFENSIHIRQELIAIFSKIFSKRIQSNKGYYIFFDDISLWNMYKLVIQNYCC